MIRNRIFYTFKPLIPRPVQIFFRRQIAAYKRNRVESIWPIDPSSHKPPAGWQGWPNGKKFALVLSHDVDTKEGQDRVQDLAVLEMKLGFRSAFNFVPERYRNDNGLKHFLTRKGFEINVHGLNHDGRLFENREIFERRAEKINQYMQEWGVSGFSSPSMHHRTEWMHCLNITHSISTFDTDPFEPQSDGAGTIFPYLIRNAADEKSFVELPYTLPQDHLLFVILQEKNIDIWKRKLDWLAQSGGMALLNTHSDYMNLRGNKPETYPREYYEEFLEYIKTKHAGEYYHALPSEISRFWSSIFQ